MREPKLFRILIAFIALIFLFFFHNKLRADEKNSLQTSDNSDNKEWQQIQFTPSKTEVRQQAKPAKVSSDKQNKSGEANKEADKEIKRLEVEAQAYEEEQRGALEEAIAKAQKEKEAEAEQMKRQEEKKAREEEASRKKEERQKEIARAKEIKEAQAKAREEELARKKEERLEKIAQARAEKERQAKAREQERQKQEAERRVKEAQLKAQKEKEAEAEQMRREEERRGHEEEITRKREEELEAEAQERADRLEELSRAREQREMELRARQEEVAQQQQERLEELQWQRERKESELAARQEELARQKAEREIEEAKLQVEQEKQKQAQLQIRQEELIKEKERAQANAKEAKKTTTQEKVITEAMLKKQKEDQAKIEKIEKLWARAKRLYDQENYEEAIKDFQKIIELEGNPRIKYTPEAEDLIEKAKIKMEEKKRESLSGEVELSEQKMLNQVVKQQIPPYLEPPKQIEEKEISPLVEPPVIRKKLKAAKITMDFDKVGLKSVIAFLAQESGINIVASQKVLEASPVVSARFKDTGLDEVLKYITKNLGLIYRVDKDVVWIASPEEIANEPMETRIYYLNKGGGLFTEFSPMTSSSSDTGLGGSSAQINKVLTIEDTLKEVIPWPADSKITYDKRLNALIVRNTPQNLQTLEDIIYNMDVEPLQVLIEARFIEVDITDTKELGIDWSLTQGAYPFKRDSSGDFKAGLNQNTGVDFSSFARAAEGFNFNYLGMLSNSQFQAVLHALSDNNKVKTLSCPRITTLNNQLATIKVVDEWIYPTRYEFEILQVPGQLPSQTPTYQYQNVPKDFLRRDVGLILKVIPAVGADKKTINLSLIPEVSQGIQNGFQYTGNVTLPKFTSRNLSTSVVVTSGDTVVLGGMITETRTKVLTKVPILGDVPLIGGLFRKNQDSTERKNLLIFVTAKVLSSSGEEVVISEK